MPEGLTGAVHVGPAAQIFDVLIENALNHGRGDLRLSVADEGARSEREDLLQALSQTGRG